MCLKNYVICYCHYVSAPGLSWDAMLDMTKVELKLILDVDKYMFFEKGIRVDVVYISKRYRKANNKYFTSYELKKKHTILFT